MSPRPALPWNGGCRCGQVRVQVSAAPLLSMACHCTGCQRMTASAYSLSLAIPEAGFAVTAGEPVAGGLHGAIGHFFCPHCLSWVFTRVPGGLGFVNLRTTMLDDPAPFPPFVETYTSEKLPWATTPAQRSYPQFPPMEAYGELIAQYQAQA